MSSLIKASNLTLIRNKKRILDNVSLSVGKKDFITIIGPNGAGKSMLIKALMGLVSPDSGSVEKKENLQIGYVPQSINPDSILPITVKGFLKLVKNANKEEIEKTISEMGMSNYADNFLHQLSGGELQKTLLARALLSKPELLVLDEPAQNLDISSQLAFYKLVEEIYKNKKIAILMVSHDLHMVMASTSKVICIYHHICCSGKPHEVMKDPEFIALFGDETAKMMAVYHHHHSHSHEHDHDH